MQVMRSEPDFLELPQFAVPSCAARTRSVEIHSMLISTQWIAFLAPPIGCMAPSRDVARAQSVAGPKAAGRQDIANRCQFRSTRGSHSAALQLAPPSALTSTRSTPSSDQAQPRISTAVSRRQVSPGAGATITHCGATDQTGIVFAPSRPSEAGAGSLYQRVVNAPSERLSASVIRVSHFTLLVP